MRFLERREVASDRHLQFGSGFAELGRRPALQIDEDAVGVAVGCLVAQLLERLEREITHASVLGFLFSDVGCVGE